MLYQTQSQEDQQTPSGELRTITKDTLSSPCPLPGLESCYSLLLTSILYHGLYTDLIEKYNIQLYKGILLSGDHGVGKTSVVGFEVCVHSRLTVPSITVDSI